MSSPSFAVGGGPATPPRSRSNSIDDSTSAPAPRVNAFPDPGTFTPHSDHLMLKNMYDCDYKVGALVLAPEFYSRCWKGIYVQYDPRDYSNWS